MIGRTTSGRRSGKFFTLHAAATAVALLACSGAEGAAPLPGVPLRTIGVGDSLTVLGRPAAFAGDIPCAADCDGIDVVLILHPDGSYRVTPNCDNRTRP